MSSRMNGYRSDRGTDRDRPPSEQLVDLHVYIVPPDIWREKFNNALNQNINDTVSVGLIRVHPETKVFVLRDEIEQQLGTEVIPREYVFLKSVGRSLTRLKSKQEYQMKAKHFLPPNAYAPEIYLLEATPEVRAALAASSEGSTRPQTQTSLEYDTYRPNYGPAKRNHGNSEGQHLQTDKSSAMSSSVGVASSTGASTVGGGGVRDVHSLQTQSPLPKIQPPTSYRQQQSYSPVGQSRTPPLQLQPSSAQFSPPQHSSEHVPPITSPRRDDYLPPLSATPPPPPPPIASRAKHSRHESPAKVFDRPPSIVHNHIIDDSGLAGYSPVNTYRENNDVLDRRKRSPETEVIQEHFVEKPEPEREEKRKLEPEPQLIHQRRKNSRNEEEEERQRREAEERRRREEEEQQRRDREEHDHLDWERQKREEEDRRRREEEARRRRDEEERRRKEEEKEKYAEMNRMKSGSDDDLAKFPSPPPPPIGSPKTRLTSAERRRKKGEKEKLLRELEAAREARHAAERQREELVRKAKQMQSKTQSRRNHAKLDSRGKAARDLWKKRYFDEKKKTVPLDEQCNKLRHELDIIHKKLISTLEGPKEKATKLQEIKPSPKSTSLGTSPNNYKIQATRLAHELEDLKRRVENSKMRLTGEMKLRNQAETELRALRAELTQKKINLTLSRNSHLTAFAPPAADIPFVTPRQAAITPRS